MSAPLVPVILSGGSGTRLWPESRRDHPKPFMKIGQGRTLIEKTVARAQEFGDHILIVTGEGHYEATRRTVEGLQNGVRIDYLLEPAGRNTAPAVALAALHVAEHISPQARLLIMPADHLVGDMVAFSQAVGCADELARHGHLVTFGIQPEHPETGYGYIKRGAQLGSDGYAVAQFVEKPDLATARSYLASGQYLWNAGMFCFQCQSVLSEMQEVCGDVARAAAACNQSAQESRGWRYDPTLFEAMPGISVDFALMERTSKAAVVPCSIDWSDIGSWRALATADQEQSQKVLIDCENTYVRGNTRLITAVGVKDLAIVDSDDALLVCPLGQSQRVKDVVDDLLQRGDDRATAARVQHADWGYQKVQSFGAHGTTSSQTAIIAIDPGGRYRPFGEQPATWMLVRGQIEIDGTICSAPYALSSPQANTVQIDNAGADIAELVETTIT